MHVKTRKTVAMKTRLFNHCNLDGVFLNVSNACIKPWQFKENVGLKKF